jgi:ethanolamine utilization microcompartment shell protein EutS
MMVDTFNPEPQDISPGNYIGWSRAIQEPKADVSKEIGLKGAGEALKGAGELGISGEENYIRNDIYSKVDSLNDNYIDRLSKADSLLGGDPSKVDQPPKAGTPGLQKLAGSIDTLTAARDNGKMSETYYYQQIYSMAKQMRSQNPMFRDYIDNQFSRITKEQPANDMIKSLTQDINTYAANFREQRGKTQTILDSALKEGMLGPGGAALVLGFRNGQVPESVALGAVAKAGSRRWEDENTIHELQIRKESLALSTDEGARNIAPVINNQVQAFVDAPLYAVGDKAESLRQLKSDIDSGKIKPTPEQLTSYARAASQQRSDIYQEVWRRMISPAPGSKDVKTSVLYTQFGGDSEKMKASLTTALSPMDDLVEQYTKGDLSTAKMMEADVKDKETGAKEFWYTQTSISDGLRKLKGLSEIGGNSPAFKQWLETYGNPPKGLAPIMKGLFSDTLQGIATQSTGNARAPNPGDAIKLGTPVTLNDAIERANQGGYNGPKAAPLYKGWLDSIAFGVADMKMPYPVKANLIAGAYGGGNDDLMFNFKPDTVNDKGQRVPGSTSAFTTLVNPKITKAMFALGGPTIQGDEPWDIYKQRAVKWFGDTFHQNLETLNSLKDSSYVKMSWDTDNHKFIPEFKHPDDLGDRVARPGTTGQLSSAAAAAAYRQENYKISFAIDNLNRGLEAIAEIAKKDPSVDVNATILRLLTSQGLDMGVLPQKMRDSVVKSLQAQR